MLALMVGTWVIMDWKRSWRYAIVTLGITLAIAGWWYVRNIILMGEPTGMGLAMQEWQGGPIPLGPKTLPTLLGALPFIHMTLWARFGNTSVPVAPAITTFFDVLGIAAVIGFIVWAVRASRQQWPGLEKPYRQQIILTAIFTFSWLFVLAYFASIATFANQARYIFPGVVGLGALVAIGLNSWFPRAISARVALSLPAMMAVIATISLVVYFAPAMTPLPLPSRIEHPVVLRFGDVAELIGTSTETPHARPGDTITFSLYWRALKPSEKNLNTYLHSVDSEVIRRDSYPATGNLLSVDWRPGQTWEERYVLTIPDDATPQTSYDLIVGLYDVETQENLPVTDDAGNPASPSIGRFAINGADAHFEPSYRFGEVIGLEKPTVSRKGDQVETCLRWVSLARTGIDYQVFVHVLQPDGTLAAQSDFQPKSGTYPTRLWTPGEVIEECITLEIPNLEQQGWHVAVGLYELSTGTRPAVTDRYHNWQQDNQIVLTP